MPRILTRTLALALALTAAVAHAHTDAHQHRPEPTLTVPADRIDPDEPLPIRLENLEPGQTARIATQRPHPGWNARIAEARATFTADQRGIIDTATDKPTAGTWSEPDPFAPLWAMRLTDRRADPPNPDLVTVRVDLDNDGQWDDAPRATVNIAPDRSRFNERDLSDTLPGAFLLTPNNNADANNTPPHPAVIILGGSEGDDRLARRLAPILAARGYAALGLPYYSPGYWSGEPKFPDLPRAFANLPLERLAQARDTLRTNPSINNNRIAVLGSSKGAEFALSAAARIQGFAAVAAIVPSDVVWEGWGAGRPAGETSGFSYREQPLAFVPYHEMRETLEARSQGENVRIRDPHDQGRAKASPQTIQNARIPVENIDEPVFLLAGRKDNTWDSGTMAANIADTREQAGLPTTTLIFDNAGHSLSGPPTDPASPADAAARKQAWPALLAFLDTNLDHNPEATAVNNTTQTEPQQTDDADEPTRIAIIGATVWTPDGDEQRDIFIEGDTFTEALSAPPHTTINAEGRYILPPLAEAHCHTFYGGPASIQTAKQYLAQGVFYAASLNNDTSAATQYRRDAADAQRPLTDALFANGGITTTEGHPVPLYRTIWTRYRNRDPETFKENLADNAFYETDTADDVRRKLNALLQTEPDIVKLYLLHSEFHTDNDPDTTSGGLDPERFRTAVRLAKQAGKRVAAHAESRADARLAADAGIDLLAHLPYGYAPELQHAYALTDDDADAIADNNLAVTATHFLVQRKIDTLRERANNTERTAQQRADDAQRADAIQNTANANLRKLKERGVNILIGSDANTPTAEIAALHATGLFTTRELIEIACLRTPQWLFPDRQLGLIQPGYEASLLILNQPPDRADDIPNLITHAFKQGKPVPETNADDNP